jgi:hypothetical protein
VSRPRCALAGVCAYQPWNAEIPIVPASPCIRTALHHRGILRSTPRGLSSSLFTVLFLLPTGSVGCHRSRELIHAADRFTLFSRAVCTYFDGSVLKYRTKLDPRHSPKSPLYRQLPQLKLNLLHNGTGKRSNPVRWAEGRPDINN